MATAPDLGQGVAPIGRACAPSQPTEENNRMGNTRDLFKKIRDTKGTFHAKMGTIKGRNGMDLTEAEDIKKSWQEYTEELYKKELHDPDNHNAVITHLEPDILECKIKWVLGSITTNKASGGDGIPAEVFQILKDVAMLVKYVFTLDSVGEGNGNPLQYSYLENPMDKGAWQARVHGPKNSKKT